MDELNDEEDARMDALEDRTRALAARVDALTEETASLRAQLAEAREREGRYREALVRFVMPDDHIEACGNGGDDPEDCSPLCAGTRAALSPSPCSCGICDECDRRHREASPSPASGGWSACRACPHPERCAAERVCTCHTACPHPAPSPATFDAFMGEVQAEAEREGPEAVAESEAWGKHFAKEAAALTPSPASGMVEPRGECDTCSTGYHDGCDYGPCACATCHPAPGKDGGR